MASMITMFLQSAYSMIDGLFVSNLIGDTALSAVNVAWPIIAVVTAIGTGVGCGGAVMMSTKQGEGKNEESNIVRANVILALLASSIVVTILFLILLTPLLKLMGAEGELLRLSQIYGRVMLTGGVLQILSCGLTPLLRNDNRAVSAMMIMVGGLFANLGLDFVFMYVFHMGIGGAAGASLCAQLFTTVCCLMILCTKKTDPIRLSQFMIRKEYWKKIFKTAVWNIADPFFIDFISQRCVFKIWRRPCGKCLCTHQFHRRLVPCASDRCRRGDSATGKLCLWCT